MLRLLHAEWLKMWKDKVFLLSILGFLGAHAVILLMFVFGKNDLVTRHVFSVKFFVDQSIQMQSLLMGPMMVALLGTYIVTIEYRQKTIKNLLPMPATLPGLFLSKCVVGLAGLAAAMVIGGIAALILPMLIGADIDNISLQEIIRQTAIGQGVSVISLSALLAFAMLVSLVTKNFVVPLGVAMAAQVAGLLIINGDRFLSFWAARPLILSSKAMRPEQMHAIVYNDLAPSLLYLGIFLVLGLLWARFTPRPE